MSMEVSWSRVRSLLRYDLMVNRKKYGLFFLAMYAAFTLTYFFVMLNVRDTWETEKDMEIVFVLFCDKLSALLWVSLPCLFVAFSLSQVFAPLKDKQGKLVFLMLPASALEKYLARLLVVLPFMLVAMLCALFLAELTHPLFVPLVDCPEVLARFTLDDSFAGFLERTQIGDADYGWMYRSSTAVFCIWMFSLFLLGGGVWYKHPFVKICGVWVAWLVLFGIAENVMPLRQFWMPAWIPLLFYSALTLFNIWFPYYRFKRLQLGKNKLF